MEGYTLRQQPLAALRGPSPLLRLASDERLVELTRRGQQSAYEALVARYQTRLLSFCRHMLGSREDAEDTLQEVFAAAYNAILADNREINVRPWLYRIARNRSLNHLRRATAIGVDSMDVHFADAGLSTSEKASMREEFRVLLDDVAHLPESQRSALILREMEALSYEQIAQAMDTTVPSVKSLLVRARIGLAEAAEARKLTCDEVRLELGAAAEGVASLSPPVRRHVKECERCRAFRDTLRANNKALAAIFPLGPLVLFKKLLLAKLGLAKLGGAGATGGGLAAGGGTGAAVAGGGAAATGGAAGGVAAGALTVKAAIVVVAAVTTAVVVSRVDHHRHEVPPPAPAVAVAGTAPPAPTLVHATGRAARGPGSSAAARTLASVHTSVQRPLPPWRMILPERAGGHRRIAAHRHHRPLTPTGATSATGATTATGATGVTATTGTTSATPPVEIVAAAPPPAPSTQEITSTSAYPTQTTPSTTTQEITTTTAFPGGAGTTGSTGASGTTGTTGATGGTGSSGATGATGTTGTSGATGTTGSTDSTGTTGTTGTTGSSGASGSTGSTGSSGATGASGS